MLVIWALLNLLRRTEFTEWDEAFYDFIPEPNQIRIIILSWDIRQHLPRTGSWQLFYWLSHLGPEPRINCLRVLVAPGTTAKGSFWRWEIIYFQLFSYTWFQWTGRIKNKIAWITQLPPPSALLWNTALCVSNLDIFSRKKCHIRGEICSLQEEA